MFTAKPKAEFTSYLKQEPKINLPEKTVRLARSGLAMLGCLVPDGFLDLPVLTDAVHHQTPGLFYSIHHLHDGQVANYGLGGQKMMILTVIQQDKAQIGASSTGLLNIEFEAQNFEEGATGETTLHLTVTRHTEAGSKRYTLLEMVGTKTLSHFDPDDFPYTLSGLLSAIAAPSATTKGHLLTRGLPIHEPIFA